MKDQIARLNEWFVPQFGPIKFRIFVGMLFLPYTGMCISFSIIGSLLSPTIMWDRLVAIVIIYFAALGISAHAADSMGSKKKPWGDLFSNLELLIMLVGGLVVAYAIGAYYIIFYVPLLLPIAILEGFFLFAYNFEIWNGFFHNNIWFAISWGSMPLLAGYVMQTNSISYVPLLISTAAFLISYIEIKLSRRYKEFRQNQDVVRSKKLESQLKVISITTIFFFCRVLDFQGAPDHFLIFNFIINMMNGIYQVKNHHFITNNDIFKLEVISHKKFDLVQRILLIDLGNTQQLLEAINNTETEIRVIEQTEEKNIISRKSCIISSTNNILAFANSKIYCRKIPLDILSEIRDCKRGIGKILLCHRLEIFKKITEIGYVEGLHIFKNYSLYHKENVICRINEIFPLKINK